MSLGECNEQLAERFAISRERQDEFARRSAVRLAFVEDRPTIVPSETGRVIDYNLSRHSPRSVPVQRSPVGVEGPRRLAAIASLYSPQGQGVIGVPSPGRVQARHRRESSGTCSASRRSTTSGVVASSATRASH